MNRSIATIVTIAILVTLAVTAPASAHSGAISNTQSCPEGTVLTVTLNDDVAAEATWAVEVRGEIIDRGSGPGPDTWQYSVGRSAGTAILAIYFDESDQNTYTTSWPAITGCIHHYRHPRAWLTGPCGDPMHHPVYDNRRSNLPTTFKMYRWDGGVLRITKRTVAPGILVVGKARHFDGSTRWSIWAHGHRLNHGISAPAGNYRACRDRVA